MRSIDFSKLKERRQLVKRLDYLTEELVKIIIERNSIKERLKNTKYWIWS